MADKLIQIVDDNDQVIGESEMFDAWQKGLKHRVARIMIEDQNGRILLQKRSANMQNFPNCWDHSAAGHVDVGEDYDVAAKRELEEEIGLTNIPLKQIDKYYAEENFKGFVLKRFSALYKGVVDEAVKTMVDPFEVAEVKWFDLDEIKKLVKNHPEQVSSGLAYVIQHYYENH